LKNQIIKNTRFKKRTCLFFVFLAYLFVPFASAAGPVRIAVIPFKMHSDQNLVFLQNGIFDMLSTRLSHPGEVEVVAKEKIEEYSKDVSRPVDDELAKTIGKNLNADYVLFGSLTVFGKSVSMDAKMVDVDGVKPPLTFYQQTQGMDEVIPAVNQFASEINQKAFGKQGSVQVPATVPEPKQTPSIYAHPERMWEEDAGREGMIPGSGSPFVFSRAGNLSGFQKSRNFNFEAEGLAIGDLTGDGLNETVIMASQSLHIFRNQEGRMAELKEIKGEKYHVYVSVDVADINKNGRSEIFVTCLNENNKLLDSFVMEWNGTDFVPVAQREKWYFRVINHPYQGKMLAGQKRGIGNLFMEGIYQLVWDGRSYVSQDKLPVPKGTVIYGFAIGDATNEGGEMVVSIDPDGQIRIYNSAGGKEWVSDERYGGSEKHLRYVGSDKSESDNRLFLPQRVFLVDSNKDNKNEVLVVKNESFTGGLFKNYRRYGSGSFQALSWDGLGLNPLWQTQKISGYVSDYYLADMNNDGNQELVATIVSRRDTIITSPKSTVIWYDLSMLAP
jgi:TolB-like protein